MVKALALFSGGLDSVLAAKVVSEQGVAVEAVHYLNAFLPGYYTNSGQVCPEPGKAAAGLGIKLHILDIADAHLQLVRSPRYGYGANINPCIDCRILMLREAKAFMQDQGFSFLISGEVLGQRPMSQRKASLCVIDRDARVAGLVLRPLSAKLMPATIAEQKGWVDREKLFAFSGRSRKPQLALAEQLDIHEYAAPAGGCLLTQREFFRKFQDVAGWDNVNLNDVELTRTGRHFHYQNRFRLVVGRNEDENKILLRLAGAGDILVRVREWSGPITVIRGSRAPGMAGAEGERQEAVKLAAALTLYYSKGKDEGAAWVDYWAGKGKETGAILTTPAKPEQVEQMRI
ncbi:MAG: hypothetical protein V1662_00530 [Candidatus Omnitrophota bacterium]